MSKLAASGMPPRVKDLNALEREPGRVARTVVAGRWAIVAFWIVAVVLAVTQLPTLGSSSNGALDDIVPKNAPAARTELRAISQFGAPVGSDVIVVQRRRGGLRDADINRQVAAAQQALVNGRRPGAQLRGVVPLIDTLSAKWREQHTTIVDYLLINPSVDLSTRVAIGQRYARTVGVPDSVTGDSPAQVEQFTQIDDVLPWITLATILVIALVVTAYFRSLLAPLVTLGTAGLAYVIAVRAVAWAGETFGFSVPREIEPLLVVFLLGLVTDYTVFFLSQARRQMALGREPLDAARIATSRVAPSVLAAGTIVAGCSCALLAAQLGFFRAFGPGLAGCALVVTAVAATLVPAVLGILGPWLFGRSVGEAPTSQPEPAAAGSRAPERLFRRLAGTRGAIAAGRREAEAEGRSSVGPVAARMLASRPIAALLVVLCIAGLGLAAGQARHARLGVSLIAGLPASSAVHQTAGQAAKGFVGGILTPTDVVLSGTGLGQADAATERLRQAIERQPGVAATLGPSAQAAVLDVAPEAPRVLTSPSGNAARIIVVFDDDPTAAQTLADFRALRAAMPGLARRAGLPAAARISYGGDSALGAQSVDAVRSDFIRIAVAMAIVTLLLLAIFLRALVAPVLLLAASALGYLAALGLTTLAVKATYGDFQITYYVPLVGAVVLVALGSDYNVLVAGRIRAESARRRSREAIAVAVPQASRAITVAGVTLAGTFAMLAVVPLRSFRELALLLTIGVLLDTVIVRSALVPGLISLAGDFAWWPGRARQPVAEEAFLPEADPAVAVDGPSIETPAVEATLAVLGERLSSREALEVGRRLPPALAGELHGAGRAQRFDADEFVQRVAERTDLPELDAREAVVTVFGALRDAMGPTEFEYVRAALSDDYRRLLDEPTAGLAASQH